METNQITTWAIDPTHSEVLFKVKHLVISTVTGKFEKFDGHIQWDGEDLEQAEAAFSAEIDSIDTGVADRDGHLKSDDFFNASSYPVLSFKSSSIKSKGDDTYVMIGDLTIRDVTKQVELEIVYGGNVTDPYGQHKAGFEISGKINRKDFGLKWSAVTEAGSVVVSDTVTLALNIQVVKS